MEEPETKIMVAEVAEGNLSVFSTPDIMDNAQVIAKDPINTEQGT